MRKKKVLVSGCFDMLHSGHIRFFEKAAMYGDVYVSLGSDLTVTDLKGCPPIVPEQERKYIIEAIRYVKECRISAGAGRLDFVTELDHIKPDVLIVNNDGDMPAKLAICKQRGIKYIVLKRDSYKGLPSRSTSGLRNICQIPYRLDLAGGWLDQPFVSRFHPGPLITICLEPTFEFEKRSGVASSTRRRAAELWHTSIPAGDRTELAQILFRYDNPPGSKYYSGSQDAIGIVFPGLNRLYYRGDFWPVKITSVTCDEVLSWIERHLYLVPLGTRSATFDPFKRMCLTRNGVRSLATAAEKCWKSILKQDLEAFGRNFLESYQSQIALFPSMLTSKLRTVIKQYADVALGWKLAGAGGGGYLILISKTDVSEALRIKIRRHDFT